MNKRTAMLAAALAVFGGAVLIARRAQGAAAALPPPADPLGLLQEFAAELGAEIRVFAGGVWSIPAAGDPYRMAIAQSEARHDIPRNLLARVLWQESRFRPDVIDGRVRSPRGALGIAQFMPDTAADLGVDPLDPNDAIEGAARYLAQLYRKFGNWREALAAYNWGQGNVQRRGLARAPEETRDYVADVMRDVGIA